MKKVRNSLTWFSHGSGAASAPVPLNEVEEFTTRPENYSIGLGDVCFCCFFGFTIFPLSMDTSCQTHQLSVQVTFPKQWICLKLLHDRLDQALLNFKCAMDDGEGELCETVAPS